MRPEELLWMPKFPSNCVCWGKWPSCSPLRQCRYLFVCVWIGCTNRNKSAITIQKIWTSVTFVFFSNDPPSTSNGKVYVSEVKKRNAARKMYDAAKKQGKTAALVATKWVQNLFNTLSSGTGFGFFGSITVSTLPLKTGTDRISFMFQQEQYFRMKYELKSTNLP